jgi:GTPase SAR1 family protein
VREASAGLILFDITDRDSFAKLDHWAHFIRSARRNSFVLIFGNKLDLPDRTVTTSEAAAFCQDKGFEYMEGSAKTSVSVNQAFEMIAQECVEAAAFDQRLHEDVVGDVAQPQRRTCC